MALDLVGGPLFTLLYDGVKEAMIKTTQFKTLLADLKSTLDSLQPRIIEQIGHHNTELNLPNDEVEALLAKMEEGVRLLGKLCELRVWNYCCLGDYTDQLIELERALRRLLEMLRIQEARDVKETLLLSRRNRDKLDEVNNRLIEIQKLLVQQQQQQEGGDVPETGDSGNSTEVFSGQVHGNGIQAAALNGGEALGVVFGILHDAVSEVEEKAAVFKTPLGNLKATLVSLKPLIEEISQHSKVLVRPKNELELFKEQMEKGVELILKCSKVHQWGSRKRSTYAEKLIELENFLQRQLYILKGQVAKDARDTLVSIRDIEVVIEHIEKSVALRNTIQWEDCLVLVETSRPTVRLDVVNVQGARDELDIVNLITDTEAGVVPFEASDDDTEVDQPLSPTYSEILRMEGVEETMISTKNTEAGVVPFEASDDDIETQLGDLWSEVAEPSSPTYSEILRMEDVEEKMISTKNPEVGVKIIGEADVVENQLRFKGISRMFRKKDRSSNAGTSILLKEKASMFRSKYDKDPMKGQISKTSYLRVFRFIELKTATRNFSTILGYDGIWKIFKGWLDETTLAPSKPGTGMIVIIKRLDSEGSNYIVYQLRRWLELMARVSHPNIVKLLGYCLNKDDRFLICEYMQMGSLKDNLFDSISRKKILSWEKRLKIATDAASGLSYLHSLHIIHRDIKPSNIFLDKDFNAKVSDSVCLMKWGSDDEESEPVTANAVGTFGYMDPEYFQTGRVSDKSDVYSFGVVLFEILTGLKSIDHNRSDEQINLVEWVRPLVCDEKELKNIMDAEIEGQYSLDEAFAIVKLALRCVEEDRDSRPSMEEVLEELECIC